ncbi:sulfatase [Calycomorphotria hydatis]|uniref:Choline-sulfatase n=1 Tax=Calycomorphotria hydatis TaxID=2528027 RepID=A0A517TBF0_9PLAN|nr:sulfatase [Calycomorphotria hydatis]QDT65702.1 Choline-sulfatase [Calycomorphotria hydatis]
MSRWLCGFALLLLICSTTSLMAETKRNVLFISTDDLNCDLGCYGREFMKTPNIDRIAKTGVRFDRAYCQNPLCSPSRSSLLTGLRPDTIKVYDLRTHFREAKPDVVTLPELFRKNDYFVARVGKIYHYGNPGDIGTNGLDDEQSWDERYNPYGRDKVEEHLITNYTPKRGLGSSLSLMAAEGTDEEQTDGMVATEIIRLMEEHKDGPFFLAAGFYNPHCPYVAPKKYFGLYPLDTIELQDLDESKEILKNVPKSATFATKPWPYLGATREHARLSKQAYYATISFVDAQVGRLLEAVNRLGLAENTLIVFWSDHGYHIGEKGLWKKKSTFERVARAPLIFSGAGVDTSEGVCESPVEFVDIYPTIADVCGLDATTELEGVSLKPLLDNPAEDWQRPAITQVGDINRRKWAGYSIRTKQWRYTEWDGGKKGYELYDHNTDPNEEHNLANDPQHKELMAQLQSQLHEVVGEPR